jgi:hypothetical protein
MKNTFEILAIATLISTVVTVTLVRADPELELHSVTVVNG